jgi:GNAT superfamily N-acetyltransferase
MTDTYTLHPHPPAPDEYRRLRAVSGLSPKSAEMAARGLPNSICGVTVLHEGRAVGMGRVIGDGGTSYQIVDIAVAPAHHRRGLGRRIMAALMERLAEIGPPGAYVSLIADRPADQLYAQFGFEDTAPASIGMARYL